MTHQFAATTPAATPLPTWLLILILIVAAIVWAAGYSLACHLWPFTVCNRCKGTGRRRSPTRRAFGDCRHCKGSGRQIRLGRRVLNWLYRTKDAAQ